MAKLNLSDQEIVQHYQERKQVLHEELQRIDTILNALGDEKPSAGVGNKRKYTRRSPAKAAKATRTTKAAKSPGRPKAAKSAQQTTAASPQTEKAPKAVKATRSPGRPKVSKGPGRPKAVKKAAAAPQPTWDDKVAQALAKIGPADKDRIIKYVADHDSSTTVDKARKALTLRLAVMEKRGKLKKSKEGDQQQYRLA